MAQTQPALDLALEAIKVIGDPCVGALDIAPDLVDQNTGDDPENGGDDEEDLLLLLFEVSHQSSDASYCASGAFLSRTTIQCCEQDKGRTHRVHSIHQILDPLTMRDGIHCRQENRPSTAKYQETHAGFLGEGPPFVRLLQVDKGVDGEA